MQKTILSFCVAAYLCNSLIADDIKELEHSIISASGFSQDIKEAPATINVIDKKALQSKPYRDIAEVISDIPGVDLYASKGKTGAYNITMRGITGYTLVLINGRRQSVGGEIGPNGFSEVSNALLPPLSSIERIEVIKGPMSTLYGSEALGGVVNIITKKVGDKWGASFSLDTMINEDSSWGNTYGTGIYASGPLLDNKLGLDLRFRNSYREQSKVEFTNGSGQRVAGDQAQSPTRANTFNIGAKFNYLVDDRNSIILDIDYSKNHYNNKNSEIGTLTKKNPNGSLTGGYTPTMDISKIVTYLAHEGIYDAFTLNSAVYYNRVTNDGREVVGQPTQAFLGQNRDIKAEDFMLDTKAVVPIGNRNILSVGAEYRLEKMHDKIANPTSFDQYMLAVYAEDEITILENLLLTLGGRYNHHEIFGNNISPRAYLVYNATDNLTLKGGVSTGFKAPYANRLIAGEYNFSGQGKYPVYGNPNLKEETSVNYEFGAIYDTGIFSTSLTGFLTTFEDKISSKTYKTGQSVPSIGVCGAARCLQAINHGEVEYKGLEFAAGVKPIKDLNIDLSWTYTDSEVKDSIDSTSIGKPEINSLKHNIVAKASYMIFNKFTPWIKGEYQIDRYMGDSNLNREYYKNIFLASAGMRYDINKNWNVNLGIYNLLDKDFTDSYESYTSANTQTWVNTYNRIEEGRRFYLSLNGNF